MGPMSDHFVDGPKSIVSPPFGANSANSSACRPMDEIARKVVGLDLPRIEPVNALPYSDVLDLMRRVQSLSGRGGRASAGFMIVISSTSVSAKIDFLSVPPVQGAITRHCPLTLLTAAQ